MPSGRSTPHARHRARRVALPQLSPDPPRRPIARSRMARWRALVLVAVHVVIAVHIVQWLLTGLTISPVEPSEAMQTLERGAINAGFVFFLLAILSTLLFGRFFCGWACHVVALQDLCGHLMRRLGIRPKPFRSRLLVFAPLALGLYMFVWPTVRRVALEPALTAIGLPLPAWLRAAHHPSLHAEFLVEDFWATFPPWYVAIPFLAICGFAAVYFLGNKGFCTYACPYGGFFAPADRVAPLRIRVTDACRGCGHCTATCSSNVRVHEEVRDLGMVVDPGCMKCMDCVSVCPNDALYLGFGRPALGVRPRTQAQRHSRDRALRSRKRRYDLSRREELLCGAVALGLFLAWRGMLGLVPMLMAAGMAAIGAFAAWTTWRLFSSPNVRLQQLQLKFKGAWRPAGVVFAAVAIPFLATAPWSGLVRAARFSADASYASIDVPVDIALRPQFAPSPELRQRARRALAMYELADSPTRGGAGWPLSHQQTIRAAYLHLLLRQFDQAEARLQQVIRTGKPRDALVRQLASIMAARGASPRELAAMYEQTLRHHPDLDGVRSALASIRRANNLPADDLWNEPLRSRPRDPSLKLAAAADALAAGRIEHARTLIDQAVSLLSEPGARVGRDDDPLLAAVPLLVAIGQTDRAAALLDRAQNAALDQPEALVRLARARLVVGQRRAAAELVELALNQASDRAGVLAGASGLVAQLGQPRRAAELLRAAADMLADRRWELLRIGAELARLATATGDRDTLAQAVQVLQNAVAASAQPNAVFHFDLAMALHLAGRTDEALEQMQLAAHLAPHDATSAQRLAQWFAQLGDPDQARHWVEESQRRLSPAGDP